MFQITMDRGMRLVRAILLITTLPALLVAWSNPAFGQSRYIKQDFPRLAGTNVGDPTSGGYGGYEDPEYHKAMAKLDFTILGIWEGWSRNGMNHQDVARAIKAINPNILLANYSKILAVSDSLPAQEDKRQKIVSEDGPNSTWARDWWARNSAGETVETFPGFDAVNITEYSKPDENGERFPEWVTKRDYDKWFYAPEWDFWMNDSVHYKEFPNGIDFSGGTETDKSKRDAAYRRGYVAHWQRIRELNPNIMIYANAINWPQAPNRLTEYDQQVEGANLEAIMGKDWSVETWGGWTKMMNWYRTTMSYLKQPKILKFNVSGSPTDYQFFRYAFASCLMDDGYFNFNRNTGGGYASVTWFDEYDLAGTSNTSWLGKAISPPQTSSWKDGVYRRDFENGVALVNPKGNGKQTVAIEPGLRAVAGKQDSVRNHGQPVTSITLNDRDGVILVRESSVPATTLTPLPPVFQE